MDIITILTTAAKVAGISPALLIAVCTVETGLKNVHNLQDGGSASLGICQVKSGTARNLGVIYGDSKMSKWTDEDLKNPEKNAKAAATYLKWQTERYGDGVCQLAASYNAGSVFESKKEPGHPKNYVYVRSVASNMGITDIGKHCNSFFKNRTKNVKGNTKTAKLPISR